MSPSIRRLPAALLVAFCLASVVALLGAAPALAADHAAEADARAIRAACLDYIESYYEGAPERMERALHPDLVKRIVRVDPESGESVFQEMTAEQLIGIISKGHGKAVPAAEQQKDVTIYDHYGDTATVKLVARNWIDYMHLAKMDGEWKIVNVLWEMKPEGERWVPGE